MPKLVPTSYQVQVKVFEELGFEHVRTTGDHMIFKKPGHPYRVVIPAYKSVPVFIIKNNIESAGITREKYFELLNEG